MQKKNLFYILAAVLVFTAVGGVAVYASTTSGSSNMSSLVNAIAQKFNLNPSDVQAVFDQQKTQMQAQMKDKMAQNQAQAKQKFTDTINQGVTDGKITQAQADLIIAKKAELDAQKPTFDATKQTGSQTPKTKAEMQADMTARQAQMKAQQDALTKWASDNSIPADYLKLLQFGGGRMGPGGRGSGFPGHNGGKPTQPATTTN